MNKYVIIGIILIILVGAGYAFSIKTDTDNCSAGMGLDRTIEVVSRKLEWRFDPEEITVGKCDRVHMTVRNEDNFDHGVAIDAFGISQRLPALGTITIDFVASKTGTFPFYCSVSCSGSDNSSFGLADGKVQAGPYAGTLRGHFVHLGKFIIETALDIVN